MLILFIVLAFRRPEEEERPLDQPLLFRSPAYEA